MYYTSGSGIRCQVSWSCIPLPRQGLQHARQKYLMRSSILNGVFQTRDVLSTLSSLVTLFTSSTLPTYFTPYPHSSLVYLTGEMKFNVGIILSFCIQEPFTLSQVN